MCAEGKPGLRAAANLPAWGTGRLLRLPSTSDDQRQMSGHLSVQWCFPVEFAVFPALALQTCLRLAIVTPEKTASPSGSFSVVPNLSLLPSFAWSFLSLL